MAGKGKKKLKTLQLQFKELERMSLPLRNFFKKGKNKLKY